MAKSNEVDLVVKARNEASKTLKTIVQAFSDLKASLDTAGESSAKGNKALGGLAQTLVELNKKAAALKALGEVSSNLDAATKAAGRLESTVRSSGEELARMSIDAALAADRTQRLRTQLEAEQSTLKKLTADRKDSAKVLSETKRALESAESAQRRLNETQSQRQRRTPGVGVEIGPPQSSARNSAAAFMAGEVEAAGRAFANAKQFIDLYDAEIRDTRKNLAALTPAVKAAADQQRKLDGETVKQTASLRQNRATLGETVAELEKLKSVSAEVEALAGKQVVEQSKVSTAYAKTAEEIERVARLSATMNRYSTGSGGFADPKTAAALQKQNAAINEAEQNWKLLESEAKRLGAAMRTVSGNATEQVNAFKAVVAASRQARAEHTAQVAALAKMQGSVKSSFAEWSKAAGGLKTFTAAAQPMASTTAAVSTGLRETARASTSLTQSLTAGNNASRNSLSLYQRMRSEIIALTASYVGLVGGAQQLMKVVDATNTLEAAQSRLNVAFQGDNRRVAAELAFLEEQADRLGVSFDVLAGQYSRFAVAAKGANFTTENTRDLFLSVAEAGRVQRISVDQLQGIFKALEQMLSKGKIQAEELRGQLGDRMTGAFKLFADAIGVTTGELDEMLKKGEVVASEDTLSKFATRLREVYGNEVPAALRATIAEMGRFENNVFKARLAIGEGGFSDGFADGLRALNEALSSSDGIAFFQSLGAALGNVTRILTELLPYVDDLAVVLGLLAVRPVSKWFAEVATRVAQSTNEFNRSRSGIFTWQATVESARARWTALNATLNVGTTAIGRSRAELNGLGAAATTTSGRVAVLRAGVSAMQTVAGVAAGSFRLLWAAIGGLPGLILTGVTFAVTSWLTKVDATNVAVTEHSRILQSVRNAYVEIEGTTAKIKDNVKGATEAQAIASVEKLRASYNKLLSDMQSVSRILFAGSADLGENSPQMQQFRSIEDALKRVKNGTASVKELSQVLNDVALNPTDQMFKDVALELLDMVNAADEGKVSLSDMFDALREGEAILRTFRDEATEADKALINGAESAKAHGDAVAKSAEKSAAFNTAMTEMGKLIPNVAEELERLSQIDALEKLYQDAAKAATNFGELYAATQRYNQGLEAINMDALGGTGLEASTNLIKKFEGFKETPYWDVNAYRVGYGSDTVTLADNSVQRVTQGMKVSVQDGLRDLVRRIGEFQSTIKSEIGSDRFNAFSKEQQAALTSIAYNYGNLTKTGELDAFKNGTVPEIADAIRRLGSHNNGVNEGRRNQEAALFEGGGTSYELEQQRFELETKANDATKKRIADKEFEVQQQQMINDGKAKEAAIEGAVREARAENKSITDEQIEKVRELAALEFDLKNTKTAQKDEQAQANELVKQAQALFQQQMALEAQLKQQQGLGDVTGAEATRLKLQEVNAQFTEAVQKARAMWEAIGGEGATTAIAKLDTLIAKQTTANTKMNGFGMTSQQVSGYVDSFATGIANAFGSFAQAIVNGENAFKAFGQAVLQTLAQIIQQIATAILRTMILRALSGMGGPIGSAAGGLLGGVSHTGGTAGSSNRSRSISAASLAAPFVYHTGGVAGMKSNEVVSVLERGETIRTEEQESALAEKQAAAERAMSNQGGGFSTLRNIITLDENSAKEFLTSATGEKAIWDVLGRNKGKLRGLVG